MSEQQEQQQQQQQPEQPADEPPSSSIQIIPSKIMMMKQQQQQQQQQEEDEEESSPTADEDNSSNELEDIEEEDVKHPASVAAIKPKCAAASATTVMGVISPDFEYHGYHKFGRVLGKGSFGTVIECFRKSDERPIALKLFKRKNISRWTPECLIEADLDDEHCSLDKAHSKFFKQHVEHTPPRLVPSEVACLVRASKIDSVVKILDYLPPSATRAEEVVRQDQEVPKKNHSVDSTTNTTTTSEEDNTSSNKTGSSQGSGIICNRQHRHHRHHHHRRQQQQPVQPTLNDDDNDDEGIIGIVLERDEHETCFFDYLMQRGSLSEAEARDILRQLVEINLALLKQGILHGDLKSENMLIDVRTKRIKVIDFGSAEIIDLNSTTTVFKGSGGGGGPGSASSTNSQPPAITVGNGNRYMLLRQSISSSNLLLGAATAATTQTSCNISKAVRTFRGTNLYKPPEFLLHHCFYPRPSTVWTFGVILYDMVCGQFPFKNDDDVLAHQHTDINFAACKSELSDSLKDLIKRCLSFYVADRIVIEKILTHPWMKLQQQL